MKKKNQPKKKQCQSAVNLYHINLFYDNNFVLQNVICRFLVINRFLIEYVKIQSKNCEIFNFFCNAATLNKFYFLYNCLALLGLGSESNYIRERGGGGKRLHIKDVKLYFISHYSFSRGKCLI